MCFSGLENKQQDHLGFCSIGLVFDLVLCCRLGHVFMCYNYCGCYFV